MPRQLRSPFRGADLQSHGDDTEALRASLPSESSSSTGTLSSGPVSSTNLAPHGFFAGSSNVNASHGVFTDIMVAGHHNITNIAIQNDGLGSSKAILDKLPHAEDAEYRCANHGTCLTGTRTTELQRIEEWEVDYMAKQVYWLRGVPGSGKSTIAKTSAVCSSAAGRLGASFFCSRDFQDRRNIRLIFTTLAYYLAFQSPEFRAALIPIINQNPHVGRETLDVQFDTILVRPLQLTGLRTTIIIDALDECEDRQPESAILSLLGRYIHLIPGVKFFITGRPELPIRKGFSLPSLRLRTEVFLLHEVDSGSVDQDIELYLRSCLSEIVKNRSHLGLTAPWPTDTEITVTIKKCSGLFIVASVIVKFVASRHHEPQERFKIIISTTSTIQEGRLGIDGTYYQVLVQSFADVDEEETEFFAHLRLVVGSIVVVFNPLSCATLAAVLGVKISSVWTALRSLHSIFIVPDSESQPIRICHKSLADYLTDETRCTDARFYIDPSVLHLDFGLRCLRFMNGSLKRNICKLPRYAMNADISDLDERIKNHVGDGLMYGCRSWAMHLRRGSKEGPNVGQVFECLTEFLEHNLLAWLEVLSVVGDLRSAVHTLQDVAAWLVDAQQINANLLAIVKDCERFVMRFFDAMESSAPHIYESALPLSPSSSLVRALYQDQLPMDVKFSTIDETWNRCVRAIKSRNPVCSIEFSHKDDLIAVGETFLVEIFEAATGQCRATFKTNGIVQSLAFSPDDTFLVAGNNRYIVNVWDLQTGSLVAALEGHTGSIRSVAFSPCGTMIASCSSDSTIRLWNVFSLDCRCILAGHSGEVRTVCWSSTGREVISGSRDATAKVWSVLDTKCIKTFRMHSGALHTIVSSPNSAVVASGGEDGMLKVLNVETDDVLVVDGPLHLKSIRFKSWDQIMYATEPGSTFVIRDLSTSTDVLRFEYEGYMVAISPDGSRLASSDGDIVNIWQTDIAKQDQVTVGHDSARASCISFIVKIWRRYITKQDQDQDMARHHTDRVSCISFSGDGQLAASGSWDETVKIWNTSTGQCLTTFSDHLDVVTRVSFSPDSTLCASWGSDDVIRIWDVRTGYQVSSPSSQEVPYGISYSPASTQRSRGSDNVIRIWDGHTGPISTWGGGVYLRDICFSPNGSQLASINWRKLELWDVATGERLASIQADFRRELESRNFSFYFDGTCVVLRFDTTLYRWRIYSAPDIPSYRPEFSTHADRGSDESSISRVTRSLSPLPMDFADTGSRGRYSAFSTPSHQSELSTHTDASIVGSSINGNTHNLSSLPMGFVPVQYTGHQSESSIHSNTSIVALSINSYTQDLPSPPTDFVPVQYTGHQSESSIHSNTSIVALSINSYTQDPPSPPTDPVPVQYTGHQSESFINSDTSINEPSINGHTHDLPSLPMDFVSMRVPTYDTGPRRRHSAPDILFRQCEPSNSADTSRDGYSINNDAYTLPWLPMIFVPVTETDPYTPPVTSPHQFRFEMSSQWVLDRHGRRVLWVPPDFVRDFQGNKVVFGSHSGRVTFVDLPLDADLQRDVPSPLE